MIDIVVEKETLYERLVAALIKQDFRFQVRDLPPERVDPNKDWRISALRSGLKFAASVGSSMAGVSLNPAVAIASRIGVEFSQEAIQQDLDMISSFTDVVGIKYTASQPVIVAIIHADELSNDHLITVAKRFAVAMQRLVEFSGQIGGVGRAQHRFGSAQLPAWGILLAVFLDRTQASNFGGKAQRDCKNFGIGRKNIVLTWVLDATSKVITRHSGAPFFGFGAMLNTDNLIRDIFRT